MQKVSLIDLPEWEGLRRATEDLYEAFSSYPLRVNIPCCSHCMSDEISADEGAHPSRPPPYVHTRGRRLALVPLAHRATPVDEPGRAVEFQPLVDVVDLGLHQGLLDCSDAPSDRRVAACNSSDTCSQHDQQKAPTRLNPPLEFL